MAPDGARATPYARRTVVTTAVLPVTGSIRSTRPLPFSTSSNDRVDVRDGHVGRIDRAELGVTDLERHRPETWAVDAGRREDGVLGRRLTLSPLVIFVALMFWTWVWGVAGALLAVPLLMAFKIVCDHVKPLGPIGELIGG